MSLLAGDESLKVINEGSEVNESEKSVSVNFATTANLSPGDIQHVLSKSMNNRDIKTLKINTVQYLKARHNYFNNGYSLVDRGANGGLAGRDVCNFKD